MSQAIIAPVAAELDLPDGYQVVWAAIDPTTGADISGVVVKNVSLFGTNLGEGTTTTVGRLVPYMLVPGPSA